MGMHKGIVGQADSGASCKEAASNDNVTPGASCRTVVTPLGFKIQPKEQTLGEYYARKHREEAFNAVAAERKLCFADWYPRNKHLINFNYDEAQFIWDAAQENKP